MEAQVTPEAQLAIFTDIRQQWINTRESLTIQLRVFKRLEDKERIEALQKELIKCETALDELDKVFAEMQGGKDGSTNVLPKKVHVEENLRNPIEEKQE